MEKISYKPLLEHLATRADYYNQLYRESELKHGGLDPSLISRWLVNGVEPIIEKIDQNNSGRLAPVFKAFYVHVLKILSNRSGIVYENEYQRAWQLCGALPALAANQPEKLLNAIDGAVESIRTYQPSRVMEWIDLMEKASVHITTIDDFLTAGRIFAWMCGLAHLRDRAKSSYATLAPDLKNVFSECTAEFSMDERLSNVWPGVTQPAFMGEAGGFIGFGGPFAAPPLLSIVQNEFVVTDGKTSHAFFADSFGKVFLAGIPVSATFISKSAQLDGFGKAKKKYGNGLIPFDDVTSFSVKENTLALTRSGSHYIYVYSCPV